MSSTGHPDKPASRAIDNTLDVWFETEDATNNWISVRVPAGTSVTYVAVYNWLGSAENRAWLGDFEVWVGLAAGDTDSANGARMCGGGASSYDASKSEDEPYVLWCGDAGTGWSDSDGDEYITLKQVGDSRRLRITELKVYEIPPPPSLPIPPRQPFTLIDDLNRRFREGRPSNIVEEGGVLLSVLDGDENRNHPWDRSVATRDRLSATLVSARHPDCYWHLFNPGFVVRSDLAQARIRCSYPRDTGTQGMAGPTGCIHNEAFGAGRLKQMMEAQDRLGLGPKHCQPDHKGGKDTHRCGFWEFGYNEIILDNVRSHPWNDDLPEIIEAIFVQFHSGDDMIAYARRFHDGFYAAYPDVPEVPLLHYNWEHPTEPFTVLHD